MVDTWPILILILPSDWSLVRIGPTFTSLIFQMSFATTATTIVSGAIAERLVIMSSLLSAASAEYLFAF